MFAGWNPFSLVKVRSNLQGCRMFADLPMCLTNILVLKRWWLLLELCWFKPCFRGWNLISSRTPTYLNTKCCFAILFRQIMPCPYFCHQNPHVCRLNPLLLLLEYIFFLLKYEFLLVKPRKPTMFLPVFSIFTEGTQRLPQYRVALAPADSTAREVHGQSLAKSAAMAKCRGKIGT